MRASVFALFVIASLGCGGGDGDSPSDGGDTGDAGASLAVIPWLDNGAPTIATADFGTCPVGWDATTADDATFCEPYPMGVMDCGPGKVHLPGTDGCALLGSVCPGGDFAADLPSDRPVI